MWTGVRDLCIINIKMSIEVMGMEDTAGESAWRATAGEERAIRATITEGTERNGEVVRQVSEN